MAGRIRLWSSYVLFFYVVTHLLNHALGLISLRVLEAGRIWFVFIWQNPVGQAVLYGALLTHFCLALWSLYRRRTLQLSRWEWSQWILGVLIVPLGTIHVVGTRIAHELYNVESGYPWVLGSLVASDWTSTARQFSLPLVVWLHACIGLHFAWRLRPWYRPWLPVLYAFALLVPIAGVAGAAIALRDVAELAQQPGFLNELFARVHVPTAAQIATLYSIADALQFTALGLLVALLLARPARTLWERRAGVVHLSYGERRTASHATGLTVLEMSRIAGIPHASVCGGRGRCSTCRVRMGGDDRAKLPPASVEEQKVLSRVGAPDNVRLACQLRPPPGRYRVTPLLPASAGPVEAYRRQPQAHGGEHYVAILFADIRGFTSISEGKLPYDVVFLLNRYFRATGQAVEAAGGRLDKFIGDGVMAIFGLNTDPQTACRQALDAARRMALALDDLNEAMSGDLDLPLRIGIGLHAGPAIVGEMGYERAAQITAIGDTVNTASRLETLTKEFGAELVVSQELLDSAGVKLETAPRHDVEIRGRQGRLAVRALASASDLTAMS
ncbi:MAG: adenylate/guanylate cyclase domain-containing protein [Reyranella sp.]|uniref:adenylate/guanylate cyclase domain-containing protein n=1 Tax=Reyranella sp. TaxID=1929291 RepID=UPI00122767F3|nr:adenylate/guanylate cyclase domain-containing protein [Reyranella sp.]TAJ41857.1 MAG: adenylate/guanylate cyclase domain-containing protein [Reyranella sp.]